MRRFALSGAVTLLLAVGCTHTPPNSEIFNQGATLPAGLPIQPWHWKVVASSIDTSHATMSTLFGNDIAIASSRTGAHTEYPAGSVLALVTWTQEEDRHWFGGRIPKGFQSMEVVKVAVGSDGKTGASYERFEGAGMKAVGGEDEVRKQSILGERASVMP